MEKRKPTIVATNTKDNQVVLKLKVDSDILDFSGHFDQFAILPGVAQVDWVVYYASRYLGTPTAFKGMEVIKFQQPIFPDAIVDLELNWIADKNKLQFKYRSADEVIHSSGTLKLEAR